MSHRCYNYCSTNYIITKMHTKCTIVVAYHTNGMSKNIFHLIRMKERTFLLKTIMALVRMYLQRKYKKRLHCQITLFSFLLIQLICHETETYNNTKSLSQNILDSPQKTLCSVKCDKLVLAVQYFLSNISFTWPSLPHPNRVRCEFRHILQLLHSDLLTHSSICYSTISVKTAGSQR